MKEEFLQFIWKNKLFNNEILYTTAGERLEILKTGIKNTTSGPDFFDSRIKIGDTLWIGNVEVHNKSSDWHKHNHHVDDVYKNVILHVVAEDDIPVNFGNDIPVFILKWDSFVEDNYLALVSNCNKGLCHDYIKQSDTYKFKFFLSRIIADRLRQKTEVIGDLLGRTNGDWGEIFYQLLARSFGFRDNGLPFEMLARSLPQKILSRHINSLFQTESLLFGQAGLLGEDIPADEYYLELKKEYRFFSMKYGLKPIDGSLWKFLRMRPVNFPTVRLAQFAALLHQSQGLFSAILEAEDINVLIELFRVEASDYWEKHYNFNKASGRISKKIGENAICTIIINVVVPFLFIYGEKNNALSLKERAVDFLERLPAENNYVIRAWRENGIDAVNALESQALLYLKDVFCEQKRCLECNIGQRIVVNEQI